MGDVEGGWVSLLVDTPPAGCEEISIPNQPIHCPAWGRGNRAALGEEELKAGYAPILRL